MEPKAPVGEYGPSWTAEGREAFDRDRVSFLGQAKPRFVIICARWAHFVLPPRTNDSFAKHLHRLREVCGHSQLIFVGQPPELPFGSDGFTSGNLESPVLRKDAEFPETTHARRLMHQRLQQFCASSSNCHFLETESYFIRDGNPYFMEGETLFYKDDDHLSVAGALRVVPAIDEILTRLK